MTLKQWVTSMSEDTKKLNTEFLGSRHTAPLSTEGIKAVSGVIPQKRSKYGNQRAEYHGVVYASKAEAKHAMELDIQKQAGEIDFWLAQVPFGLPGGLIYKADFVIFRYELSHSEGHWQIEVHEVKGFFTKDAKIKLKLFRERYPNLVLKVIR